MLPWAIEFLVFLVLPVLGSKRSPFGRLRTRRAPNWRVFSESVHGVEASIKEAEPYLFSASAVAKVTESGEGGAFHLAPERYLLARQMFTEKLDKNGNGALSEPEFLNLVSEGKQTDSRLLDVGREIFKYFASSGEMTRAQFLRFFSLCVVDSDEPGEGSFIFKAGELSGLTAQEKSCVAKLFVILDDNSNGEVDKAEFDRGQDGDLLRQVRKQGYVNCGPANWQLQRADRRLHEYSGDEPLSIDRFYELTAEVTGENPKPLAKSAAAQLQKSVRLMGVPILAFAVL